MLEKIKKWWYDNMTLCVPCYGEGTYCIGKCNRNNKECRMEGNSYIMDICSKCGLYMYNLKGIEHKCKGEILEEDNQTHSIWTCTYCKQKIVSGQTHECPNRIITLKDTKPVDMVTKMNNDVDKLKKRVKKIEKTLNLKKPKNTLELESNDEIARELIRRLQKEDKLDSVVRSSLVKLLNVPFFNDKKYNRSMVNR